MSNILKNNFTLQRIVSFATIIDIYNFLLLLTFLKLDIDFKPLVQ